MPSYKLVYFNVRARAEDARYMFALSGTEYEDFRFEGPDWPKYKPNTPLGQVPYLEVDGKGLPQSNAINRYLARELGFYGKDSWESAQVDVVGETISDMRPHLGKVFQEKDEAKKDELRKDILEDKAQANLALLEKLLVQNGGGDGFFVGDKISLADINVLSFYGDFLPALCKGVVPMDKSPKVKALIERLVAIPQIAQWRANRPVTSM